MEKKAIFAILTVLFLPFIVRAEWVIVNEKKTAQTPPDVILISDDNNCTVIKIDISGFDLNDLLTESKTYQFADLLTESITTKPGFPALPYIAKVLAVPDQAAISYDILEIGEIQTFPNINLPPARESWQEGQPETPYIENLRAFGSNKIYPNEYVKIESPAIFRDFRIARISVFPVRYIAAKKELQIVTSLTVRINYNQGVARNPKNSPKKPIAHSFDQLYRNFIFNYENVLTKKYGSKDEEHELMLCIMPDDFYESFQTYAEWKRQSGIDIHITKFSDIGANSNDPVIIKNHIADAYFNWEVPPTYVLLVGDDGVFPVYANYTTNENYFGEIEGDDYFPDVMVGRLTNQSVYQMQVMINKFQLYEQTPDTASTDWFKKGICCSNDAYPSQVETKRFAASQMLEYGNFISVDTMMDSNPCNYSLSDAINAINSGRSFLNYRGEGWSSGWNNYCVEMEASDVSTLINGQKLTFVTSIGCGVAMFAGGSNCFGEAWIELGSISSPKGASAFIGPTGNTHTTYNNKIDKGIYVGMFQEGMDTPGQAMLRGKLYMYNVFGNEPYVESHYKLYCILGDPSIHIWKDVPQSVTVDYPASIPFGNNTVEFTVIHSSTGLPVSNAVVCVTGDTTFATGITNEQGIAYVEVETQQLQTFNVTVRGGTVFPFQGILLVAPPTGPYVVEDSYMINDVSGGNGNGLLDYGETNLLNLTMINVGVEQADNVVVSIHTNNPYITITDSIADYGTIAPGATGIVTDGFAYTVANDIPDLEEVSFFVTATNGIDSWESIILIEAHAPILEYDDYEIADPTGNNNGLLDPGETIELFITLKNIGSSEVVNVIGELIESDPFITINTPQMSFGNIAGGGSQATAVYSLSADISTPTGHLAEFTLALNADLGITGTEEFVIIVGQVPVLILDLDENGNSAPDIEASLNTMNITFEKLTSFPPDLSLYSTVFVCLGIFSQNHVLSSSEGQTLANYLVNGGSIYMEGGDTWCYDQGTSVHDMFNINPITDGSSNMEIVEGNIGTFAEGMVFNYSGENSFMDQIEAIEPAVKIFENTSPSYGTGIAYNNGDYKTIGSSHEFGGLDDGTSPSTKEELMSAYLDFFGILQIFQASFTSNTTYACIEQNIEFYDMSSSSAISWEWEFEGGTPATSSSQNQIVTYLNPGTFDVSLTISDGTEFSTLTLEDYMVVVSAPNPPAIPTGDTIVCTNLTTASAYLTTGANDADSYAWNITPIEAGAISGNSTFGIVQWTNNWEGTATISVKGVSDDCGEGEFSEGIDVVCSICTGIGENENQAGIHIFPNPSTGMFTVNFENNVGAVNLTVTNILSEVIIEKTTTITSGNSINIDLREYPKGLYFIKVKTDTLEKIKKVILR